MKRIRVTPRVDWEAKTAAQGLSYSRVDGRLYWDESVAYEFTAAEIEVLETATNALHQLCLQAGQTIIDRGWIDRLGLPAGAAPLIEHSWEADAPSLYGRFDLAYDGTRPPVMLEYNADTPTALVEAAVCQWFWLKDVFPDADQFNSIHERLIAAWKRHAPALPSSSVHLCAMRASLEDNQTILYLADTALNAGLSPLQMAVEDLGWDGQRFVDLDRNPISTLFKLYPWEWLLVDQFGANIPAAPTFWFEPAWKMMFSSKGILPILWELFPGHPNLLPAFFIAPGSLAGNYVRKPLLSREGRNVSIFQNGRPVAETEGPYDTGGYVYQARAETADFDGQRAVLGSWVIDHEAAGIGVREDKALISSNESRFVPHLMR